MKKRIFVIFLTLILLLGVLSAGVLAADTVDSGKCGEDLTWELDSDGVLTISGTGAMYNYAEFMAPWFQTQTKLNSVVIGDGVTSIGNYGFSWCETLSKVTIPDSVTSIGKKAFYYCESIESITIPDGVTSIGDGAFQLCRNLSNVTLSAGLTSIGSSAFDCCNSLTSITIPDSVTSIGDEAFSYCSSLTGITIPDNVTSIGDGAFKYCDKLSNVTLSAGLTSIGNSVFDGCSSLASITIPDSVTSVGDNAFQYCWKLKDVYYKGTMSGWTEITFGTGNEYLTSAAIHTTDGVNIPYLDEEGVQQTCPDAVLVCGTDTKWWGWRVVKGDLTINNNVELTDDVNLILADGATLTVNGGIRSYSSGNSLTIYAQSNGTGKLISNGTDSYNGIYVTDALGIYGGTVEATGGSSGYYGMRSNGDMTIKNCTVTASGKNEKDSCGMSAGGYLTIMNSTVTAIGKNSIGVGAANGAAITNSTVTASATADDTYYSPGMVVTGDITITTSMLKASGPLGMVASEGSTISIIGGNVTLDGDEGGLAAYNADVTVSGNAVVAVSSGTTGIEANSLIVSDSVNVTVSSGTTGIRANFLTVSDSASVTLDGDEGGLAYDVDITVSGNAVVAATGGEAGIRANSLTVSDSANVTGTGGETGIRANSLTVSDSANVTGTAKTADTSSYGIGLEALTVNGGTVKAYSGKVSSSSVALSLDELTVTKGNVIAISAGTTKGWSCGIQVHSDRDTAVTISGGSVTATGGDITGNGMFTTGISADNVPINISGGTVTATGGNTVKENTTSCGIQLQSEPLNITGGTVTATAGNVPENNAGSWGVCYYSVPMSVSGGTLIAKGKEALMEAPDLSGFKTYYWRTNASGAYTASTQKPYVFDRSQNYVEISENATGPKPPAGTFVDVKPGAYYAPAVDWAVANNITSGTSPTTFSPDDTCTRAQVVAFLWRAAGRPEPQRTNNPFTDVKSSDYFYKAVLWASENGIVYGTSSTTFSPNQGCTRGQVAAFLWRAKGRPEPTASSNPFTDVKASEYYSKAVTWAAENKIVYGTSSTTFSPDASCTRAQIVTFLYRTYGK